MEKKFKCKDEVIYRSKIEYGNHHWTYGIFSHYEHYQDVTFASLGCLSLNINDWDILPYEGNENLVGTSDSPDEEMILEEGELIIVSSNDSRILSECLGILERFKEVDENRFISKDYDKYEYAIRFRDFDPSNMEETRKHILAVKNGRIIRYKG